MNEMINRRLLLQGTGALIVTFSLMASRRETRPAAAAKTVSPGRADGFLAVGADGQVMVYSGKVELGTGVQPTLTQVVAEELDVPMSRTLKEEVTFDRSMVTSLGWASYPILTFPKIPEVIIDLIDRPREVPGRRGTLLCGRAFGNRRCRFRGDRRPAALDTVHARQDQGDVGGRMTIMRVARIDQGVPRGRIETAGACR